MSVLIAISHAIETTMLPGIYLSQDGIARSARRAKTFASRICDSNFGDEVGIRALQDGMDHPKDKQQAESLPYKGGLRPLILRKDSRLI